MSMENKKIESSVFCMAPWTHLSIYPDGQVYPCCASASTRGISNIKKGPLREIWNTDRISKLRLDMLNNRKNSLCKNCYDIESSGGTSYRNYMNNKFSDYLPLINKTKTNGELDVFKLRLLEIRFSNICNFKCRFCTPILSTSWYKDYLMINKNKYLPKIISEAKRKELLQNIFKQLPYIKEIYFSGGEPLLMEEHYLILKELIKLKRTDIKLRYNSNLSTLKYKDINFISLINKFRNVDFYCSLDAFGNRVEYIRKGICWKDTIKRINLLKKESKHINFLISSVLCIFNAYHLPDFHRYILQTGLIEPDSFNLSILSDPKYYRISILPPKHKELVEKKYLKHINYLSSINYSQSIINMWKSSINYLKRNNTSLLPKFIKTTRKLDQIRNEDIKEIFPEYLDLF